MKNKSLLVFAVLLLVIAAWLFSQQFAFHVPSPSESAGLSSKVPSFLKEENKNYDADKTDGPGYKKKNPAKVKGIEKSCF